MTMAKFKIGDTIHKIGEKQFRPFKIEQITEDRYYVTNEDKGLFNLDKSFYYIDIECEDLYELVTDVIYEHYTKQCLIYPLLFQRPKIELDEKKIRELLESSEMHSRFSMHDFLEQSILQMRFIQDSNGDMMRKPIDDFNQNNMKI